MLVFKIALPPLLEQALPSPPGADLMFSRWEVDVNISPVGRARLDQREEGEIPREEWEQ